MSTIGILGLQGCIEPHIQHFESLGANCLSVRTPEELSKIDALLLPGGESTTMMKLLHVQRLYESLREFVLSRPSWGICAGSILLAQEVENPAQESLGVARIRAKRNAYGSQLDSFKAQVAVQGLESQIQVDFIRAPQLFPLDSEVEVLAEHEGDSVVLRDRHLLCSSFHTELGSDSSLHRYFLEQVVG